MDCLTDDEFPDRIYRMKYGMLQPMPHPRPEGFVLMERPLDRAPARTGRLSPQRIRISAVAVALAALIGLSHTAGAQSPSFRRAAEPKPGTFLYASPDLPDAHFAHTVVVLVTYSPDGAMGVIINRPTEIPAQDAIPDLKDAHGHLSPLYFGGPVDPTRILFMTRGGNPPEGSLKVMDHVFLSWSRNTLDESLKQDPSGGNIRMYAGYAGWGPGQLDAEINRGDWVLSDAEPETIFSDKPTKVWDEIYDLINRIEVRARVPRPVPASWKPPAPVPLRADR